MNQKLDAPGAVIGNVVRTLIELDAKKVTAYLSENLTVKASRVMYAPTKRVGRRKVRGKPRINGRDTRADIAVTVGVPNYAERRFIKACKAAGEPFPVKKLQIRMPA